MLLSACYFTWQKLSKSSKTCFTKTKETALAPFNLAYPVRTAYVDQSSDQDDAKHFRLLRYWQVDGMARSTCLSWDVVPTIRASDLTGLSCRPYCLTSDRTSEVHAVKHWQHGRRTLLLQLPLGGCFPFTETLLSVCKFHFCYRLMFSAGSLWHCLLRRRGVRFPCRKNNLARGRAACRLSFRHNTVESTLTLPLAGKNSVLAR